MQYLLYIFIVFKKCIVYAKVRQVALNSGLAFHNSTIRTCTLVTSVIMLHAIHNDSDVKHFVILADCTCTFVLNFVVVERREGQSKCA